MDDGPDPPDSPAQDPECFPIVGVGASAGGVAALQEFVAALEPDTQAAVVLLLHLPNNATSRLAELLDPHCPLPVRPISDGQGLEAGTVSVLPPGSSVDLDDGHLRLHPRPPGPRWRPVDRFFNTLAVEAAERAVAVVLSGTGTNGSVALCDIKRSGGMVLVQQPEEAGFNEMPRSAIASGRVDRIGSCAELARAISAWSRRLPRLDTLDQAEREAVDQALALVRTRTGRDFRCYKRGTMERRIQRRTSLRFCDSTHDYLTLLRSDEQEVDRLAQDLLIGVTAFFRDVPAWEMLSQNILPELIEAHRDQSPFRAWVAGCSSGEEAYTLAMVMAELIEAHDLQIPVQIFATDIDNHACERARRGLFPSTGITGLDERRLAEHFTREDGAYRISSHIRDMITFAQHNLLRDPPFSQLDLISCRNVLIYLDNDAQEQVLGMFHFALRRNGVLLLGSSESAQRHENLFQTVDDTNRVYRRREVASPPHPFALFHPAGAARLRLARPQAPTPRHLQQERHDLAMDLAQRHFAPAFVLIDERHQISYYSGPTNDFLHLPDGAPNDDLLSLCSEHLRPRLRGALRQIFQTGDATDPLVLHYAKDSGMPVEVTLQTVTGQPGEQLCLVSFRERSGPPAHTATEVLAKGELDAEQTLQILDQELRATREELSSSIEELETSNEELKASNEEVRSMYEELQSTNEELETSREELQAVNEELNVLNRRLQNNITELAETNDVLGNLLSSTNLPTVFLDKQLRIQRFTPAASRLMRLIPGDVGRPFQDIADRISHGRIQTDAAEVLDTLIPIEREVQAADGRWFLSRVHPYRTADDRIDGTVVTLSEITSQKQAAAELRSSELRFRSIFENAAVGILQCDADGRIRTVNTTIAGITGLPRHLLQDRPFGDFFDTDHARQLASVLTAVQGDGSSVIELPLRTETGKRWLRCTCSNDTVEQNGGFIIIVEDISDRRAAEQDLYQRTADLERSNEDLSHFATMASHDLQAPLRLISLSLDLVGEIEDLSPEERRKHFATAKDSVQRMRRMVVDMLAYARAEMAGGQQTSCDLTDIVAQVRANLGEAIDRHQAEVHCDALPQVQAPPRLLEQLLQNLIDNALKYRRPDVPPRIRISAERGDAAWIVHVADNGRGVPTERRERVFDLFDRSGSEATESESGSGIGLAICRRGIERIGGRIWLTSEPGQGSTFSFSIPDPSPGDHA
ncbi:MAG: CheR family methyltransferase [Planctomycetota bacterium]